MRCIKHVFERFPLAHLHATLYANNQRITDVVDEVLHFMLENDVLQVALAKLLTHEDCLLQELDGLKAATGLVSLCSFLHKAMYPEQVLLVSRFRYAMEHQRHLL